MSNDYHDAVDDARLDAAARNVLRQSLATCPGSVRDMATSVVADTFCSCVTDAEDVCEGRLSAIHAILIEEVVRRVRAFVAEPVASMDTSDEVDVASEHSFPASDPPSWIWGSPTD